MSKSYRTSINLDEHTSEIIKKMPNRSAFMRECIRRWHASISTHHLHPTEAPRCYPHSKLGVCPICWPNGIISAEDWKYYRQLSREGQNMEGWADEKLIQTYAWDLPPTSPERGGENPSLWQKLKKYLNRSR